MRQPLVAGNWKMHGTAASIAQLLLDLAPASAEKSVAQVVVCPTFIHIAQVVDTCKGTSITVGAQDCSHAESGAYTGEVAARMVRESGCDWVILGHSERRQYHSESDELVAAKLRAAVAAGLTPIVCVGESREQRENGDAQSVVAQQLFGALAEQPELAGLVIAYEPVWAIGTGLTATPQEAQEMHAFIRECLADVEGLDSTAVRVLYGGSVKSANAAQLFAQADIDGALVGGAALVAEDFLAIINAAA